MLDSAIVTRERLEAAGNGLVAEDSVPMFARPDIEALLLTQWSEPNDGSYSWATYGLSEATRRAIVSIQGGRCSICGDPVSLVVDHCHDTHRARGLICGRCNGILGRYSDDPAALRARAARSISAAMYLEASLARPYPVAARESWLAQRAARSPVARAALAAVRDEPAPAPAPARELVGPVEEWPPGRLHRFPTRRVVLEKSERSWWTMWCPNEKVDRDWDLAFWENPCSQDPAWYVGQKGIARTGEVLVESCTTAEQTIAFYARAFARSYRERLEPEVSELAAWMDASTEPWLDGVPGSPWHERSVMVLPHVDLPLTSDWWRYVRSRQDFLDACLISWRCTTERWTILEFVDRRFAERDAA